MRDEFDQFIESWGSMGVFWGINRSMARIHAFMMVSEDPVDLDTISENLNISRGNASMCLKELRQWGVIQRVHVSGKRRDFYKVEPDAWKMIFKIVAGRKNREFDPALQSLRLILREVETEKTQKVHERLTQIEEIFTIFDGIINKYLKSEKNGKTTLDFMKNFV
jgi:DNA-binding transcriptional regulator GbsR (MarR family)